MGVGIREWGLGNGEWGIGIGIGVGIGIGIGIGIENREPSADSRKRIAETGEWGFGNGDWGLRNNVYKKGCEKMVIIFSQPFFIYPISW